MKFAICQELFEGWDWERQCRFIAEVGYQGIEVAPFTLAPRITDLPAERRQTLRRQAADHGLQIIGLHWLLAKTTGLHITSPDAAVRRATAEYLTELGRACADLGGDILVFGSPAQRSLEPGTSRAAGFDRAAEVLRACLPALEERGVKLCLEPLTPKETNFLNTCADAIELIDRVGSPNLLLHQDVKAMLTEATPISELIARYSNRVGHFHANDSNLLGPGMGTTDFTPIFAALVAARYAGWVSVEVFDYSPGCERIARESLANMRAALANVS
jgi:sugar phosphate isomerase/epimerase